MSFRNVRLDLVARHTGWEYRELRHALQQGLVPACDWLPGPKWYLEPVVVDEITAMLLVAGLVLRSFGITDAAVRQMLSAMTMPRRWHQQPERTPLLSAVLDHGRVVVQLAEQAYLRFQIDRETTDWMCFRQGSVFSAQEFSPRAVLAVDLGGIHQQLLSGDLAT